MNFINKLERKYGKYAVPNLMFYIIVMYGTGALIQLINHSFYMQYLSLDVNGILNGQIWRLFTFLIQPPNVVSIWLLLELYLYYFIGTSLERQWGAFRFNLYYITGILFNIVAIFFVYFVSGQTMNSGLMYINRALFLAFAALYPNVQFRIMFIIPLKVKYLGILYMAYILFDALLAFMSGYYAVSIAILVSIGNFLIYFFSKANYRKYSPKEYKRKRAFQQSVQRNTPTRGTVTQFPGKSLQTRHKCSICDKTELDDEDLEFRFCSKCDGEYEYCSEHIFTHEHVKNQDNSY